MDFLQGAPQRSHARPANAIDCNLRAVHELHNCTNISWRLHWRQSLVLAGMKLHTLGIDKLASEVDIGGNKVAISRADPAAFLQANVLSVERR